MSLASFVFDCDFKIISKNGGAFDSVKRKMKQSQKMETVNNWDYKITSFNHKTETRFCVFVPFLKIEDTPSYLIGRILIFGHERVPPRS